jgi:AcrR family transcriptional regulator
LPKIVDHDARRVEILSQCFALFAERGYTALTMREIATHLEVSTGTLYHYFDGKLHLFESMFAWIGERDASDAAIEIPPELDLATRSQLLVHYLIARSDHMTQVIKVAIDFQRQHPEESAQIFNMILSSYRSAIANQLGLQGDLRVNTLLSLILGALIHHAFDPENVPLEPQLQQIAQFSSQLSSR